MESALRFRQVSAALVLLLLTAFAASAAKPAANRELAEIRTVYLLPMGNGLDQFLANHLTRGGRFQVVTDHRVADAVLTDRLGAAFEAKLQELYAPPESGDDDMESAERAISPSFNRSRGNLFLVDRRTRSVLWSQFKRPRNSQPDELDRLAEYFAVQLKKRSGPVPPTAAMVSVTAAEPVSPPPAPEAPPVSAEPKSGSPAPTPK